MDAPLFQRSKYSNRTRLTAEDLENQQAYDSGKRRLLNRALYGRGVVYGLGAEYDAKCGGFLLGEGLAFDGLGRELFVAKPTFF